MRITVIGLVAALALWLFAWVVEPSKTVPGYEETLALIEREIRVGSTRQEARERLKAHQIEYGYSSREDLDFIAFRDNRLPKESPVVGRIHGILRDVKKGFITTTSYSI